MAVKSKRVGNTRYNYDSKGRLTSITHGKQGHTHNVKTANHPSKRRKNKGAGLFGWIMLGIMMLIGYISTH